MTEKPLPVALLDESAGVGRQGYTLTRLLKIGEHKVRIRIERDAYMQQSNAVAEVYNADHTWTRVLSNPPSNWHKDTPRPIHPEAHDIVRRALGSIADELTDRVTRFLDA